jgi:hypothetical protein
MKVLNTIYHFSYCICKEFRSRGKNWSLHVFNDYENIYKLNFNLENKYIYIVILPFHPIAGFGFLPLDLYLYLANIKRNSVKILEIGNIMIIPILTMTLDLQALSIERHFLVPLKFYLFPEHDHLYCPIVSLHLADVSYCSYDMAETFIEINVISDEINYFISCNPGL